MPDRIFTGLQLLSTGLRPYVTKRASAMSYGIQIINDIEHGDAQFLLVLMWDHWNELFRQDLSFVERCLISELRDFRNRWAHQGPMSENDIYRVLDGIERLLCAIHSDQVVNIRELRRESLNRLWQAEIGDNNRKNFRAIWPFVLYFASAAALCFACFRFYPMPWNGVLTILIIALLSRLAWAQSIKDASLTAGPKECFHCGRVIYSTPCPYCRPSQNLGIDPRMTIVLKNDETLLPTHKQRHH